MWTTRCKPIGEDFRVDNAVFAADKKEPISQSVTIFHDGIVYDCMKTPAETVVFDRMMKRFVLLNMENATRSPADHARGHRFPQPV